VIDASACDVARMVSQKIDWKRVNAERERMRIFSGKFISDALAK